MVANAVAKLPRAIPVHGGQQMMSQMVKVGAPRMIFGAGAFERPQGRASQRAMVVVSSRKMSSRIPDGKEGVESDQDDQSKGRATALNRVYSDNKSQSLAAVSSAFGNRGGAPDPSTVKTTLSNVLRQSDPDKRLKCLGSLERGIIEAARHMACSPPSSGEHGWRVLDVGGGSGGAAAVYLLENFEVCIIEADSALVRALKQHFLQAVKDEASNLSVKHGKAPEALKGEWADVIRCDRVIPYLSEAEVNATLGRMTACLNPGGVVFLCFYHPAQGWDQFSSSSAKMTLFTAKAMLEAAEKQGLEVESVRVNFEGDPPVRGKLEAASIAEVESGDFDKRVMDAVSGRGGCLVSVEVVLRLGRL